MKKIRKLHILLVLVLAFFSLYIPATAQSILPACEGVGTPEEQQLCTEKIYQKYGVTLLDNSSGGVCATTGNLDNQPQGSEAEKAAFSYLVSNKGFTKEQAAGMVGNMIAESAVEPQRLQNTPQGTITPASEAQNSSLGWGLVQWTPAGKFINDPDVGTERANDFYFQLDFLVRQLNGETSIPEKPAGDDLKGQTTVDGAARSFMLKFERPADKSTSKQNERVRLAEGVFQRHANSVTGVSTDGGAPSCQSGEPGKIIDGFVLYSQFDPSWADKPYGSSTIATAGCGPSAVAMAIATLTGDRGVNPETIANRYSQYYVEGEGSSWDLMNNVPGDFNLTSKDIGKDAEAAKEALRAGSLVVVTGEGAKPFTSGGHILVLRGITDSGMFLIGDSGHDDTSDAEHAEADLMASIRNMWVISK